MLTLERGRRVGQSQATSIFWGLVSTIFAAAACYYFWKYHENESNTNVLRDQVMTLQEERDTLNSQKEQLQSNISETETQLKTREDFLQEKETKLGEEESRLEALGVQSDSQSDQSRTQAVVLKKFNDAVRKLVKGDDTDVVVRGGRPVLRVPNSVFFDFGAAILKPDGKALLKQIAQALDGQLENFQLQIETFTDATGEADSSSLAPPPEPEKEKDAPSSAPTKVHASPSWELTGKRAGVLSRFLRDETSLPFQNVIVVPRADFQPIISGNEKGDPRNRRIEIMVVPLPVSFHPSTGDVLDAGGQAVTRKKEHRADKTSAAAGEKAGSSAKTASKENDGTEAPVKTSIAKKSTDSQN